MYSPCDNAALPALGFPIRESTDQRLFNASPWLIAVVHALLRLLVPRHPPCALDILTVIARPTRGRATMKPNFLIGQLCGFQGPEERNAAGTPRRRSLKTQQCGSSAERSSFQIRSTFLGPAGAYSVGGDPEGLPRKEVIQPHLPVRLPCYDFTPI